MRKFFCRRVLNSSLRGQKAVFGVNRGNTQNMLQNWSTGNTTASRGEQMCRSLYWQFPASLDLGRCPRITAITIPMYSVSRCMAAAPILTHTDSFWSLVLTSAAEDAKSGPVKSVCNSLGHVSWLQVKLQRVWEVTI